MKHFLLSALLLVVGVAHGQVIHTEAADAYWRLTDALRHDEPLTNAAWQQLMAMPDNKVYVAQVWGADTASLRRYRRAIEVVYRPRYDSLRRARIKSNYWTYVLVNQYKEHESADRAFLTELVKDPALLNQMYAQAYAFLPARNHTKIANLHLAYVALGNDATSEPETGNIIFSVHFRRVYQNFPGILEGHEMHHQLRSHKDFGSQDSMDQGLLWALTTALDEGLADLVDKRILVEQTADTAGANYTRRWLLTPAPTVLQKIDSTIQRQAAGGLGTSEQFYRGLTNGTNGHLPGFFMAYTILQNGYLKRLLDHADDPLTFALLYQKAAKRDQQHQHPPILSPITMRYLRQLTRKYAKPQPTA